MQPTDYEVKETVRFLFLCEPLHVDLERDCPHFLVVTCFVGGGFKNKRGSNILGAETVGEKRAGRHVRRHSPLFRFWPESSC